MSGQTAFDRAIDARPTDVAGRYAVTFDPGWNAPTGPNGGYIAAIVVRALTQAVGDASRPVRTLTLHYMRPPQSGEGFVDVVLERVGATVTTATIRVIQAGKVMTLAVATCAGARSAPAQFLSAPPPMPPIEETPAWTMDERMPSIAHRFAFHPVPGPMPFSGADEARTGGWLRLPEPRTIDAEYLAIATDAWIPALFARLTTFAAAPTLELTIHFRHYPQDADDTQLFCHFTTETADEGFMEENGWIYGADGRLLAQSRQLAVVIGMELPS